MADTSMQTTQHAEALRIVQSSGILNPKMPVSDLLSLTQKLSQESDGQPPENARVIRYVIHDHFVFLEASAA